MAGRRAAGGADATGSGDSGSCGATRPGRDARTESARSAQPSASHVSVTAVSRPRGPCRGWARRSRCFPVGPGSAAPAAALSHIDPSPGPEPRGVFPPLPPGAEDAHKSRRLWAFFPPKARPRRPLPRNLGWAGPDGGPKAPAWALAGAPSGSPRCPRRGGRLSWEWGGGDKGDELIFLVLPAGLSGFGARPEVADPGLWPGFSPKWLNLEMICSAWRGNRPYPGEWEWEADEGSLQAARLGHPAELFWRRSCSPRLGIWLSLPWAPSVRLSLLRSESSLQN